MLELPDFPTVNLNEILKYQDRVKKDFLSTPEFKNIMFCLLVPYLIGYLITKVFFKHYIIRTLITTVTLILLLINIKNFPSKQYELISLSTFLYGTLANKSKVIDSIFTFLEFYS